MTKQSKLRILGFILIALAAIGSLASSSVVRAGGTDGAIYLGVNITLAVIGAVLLMVGSRVRPPAGTAMRTSQKIGVAAPLLGAASIALTSVVPVSFAVACWLGGMLFFSIALAAAVISMRDADQEHQNPPTPEA